MTPTLVIPEWPAWLHARRYRAEIEDARVAVSDRRTATAKNFDAVWFPWNGMSWTTDAPAIATLHDASLYALPAADADVAARERKPFEAAAAGARRILTDSAFSKSELEKHLRIAPERIAVVPLGVSTPSPRSTAPARFEGLTRYLLFVGEPENRKGLDTFADAVALLAPSLREGLGIVLAGKGTEAQSTAEFDVPLRRLGHVDDRRLAGLYAGATAFVYPSRYEGFGLPVLEAMSHGTPVIASDFPAIAEAGGDAALYFPVGDAARLAALIGSVLGDASVGVLLKGRSLLRASAMTWDKTAALTLSEIVSAIAQNT